MVDEPLTGRAYDGENYNIGFLTVTDTPYPELVAAARAIHRQTYQQRPGRERSVSQACPALKSGRGGSLPSPAPCAKVSKRQDGVTERPHDTCRRPGPRENRNAHATT